MLQYNFERVLKARGIEHPYAYLTKMGIHINLASHIRGNKVRLLKMASLEKLCLLLRCTPNDLMEWVPGEDQSTDKKQPLYGLIKSDRIISLTQTLNSLPLDKAEEIEKYIEEQISNQEE